MSAKAEDFHGATIKGCKILFRIGVKKNNTSVHWRARCMKCDEEFDVRAAQLRSYEWHGHRCKSTMHGRTKDLTGVRIYRAVVLSYVGPNNGGIDWLCKCDICGKEFVENSLKLLAAHNEIRKRHLHKCEGLITRPSCMEIPGMLNPRQPFDIGARFRLGKVYRAAKKETASIDDLAIAEVIAYQRATGSHVVFGW